MDTSRSTITSLNTDINLQNPTDINLQNPMADTATTDTSQHMAMIPMVIKRQAMAKNPMVTKRQPMAKIPMVTKRQLTADTITTDTSRPMATIHTVTKSRCTADTKSMVMVILTDTKNPTERSTTPATLIIPSKKSVNMLMLKKTTKHNP